MLQHSHSAVIAPGYASQSKAETKCSSTIDGFKLLLHASHQSKNHKDACVLSIEFSTKCPHGEKRLLLKMAVKLCGKFSFIFLSAIFFD